MNPIFADLPTTVFEAMSRLARETGAINLGQGFPDDPGPEDRDGDAGLPEHVLLREEFDRLVAGPMNADLSASHDPETVFEANLGTRIEPEEVAHEIAEVAGAEWTAEPVRHPECAGEARNLERGRQADDGEVRL